MHDITLTHASGCCTPLTLTTAATATVQENKDPGLRGPRKKIFPHARKTRAESQDSSSPRFPSLRLASLLRRITPRPKRLQGAIIPKFHKSLSILDYLRVRIFMGSVDAVVGQSNDDNDGRPQ
ncbi:hypothetical protein E2C01_034425 [Portunus trituberculatus]|uniref:Uncharacterized protein n=1 Tax=Portunus trituberculatus TaxID=210409 RepID=A0A5B7F705_PORTR|nr:hypothetical protein [Portunus trituberculatus]